MQSFLASSAKSLGFQTIVTDLNPNCFLATKADYFFAISIFDVDGHLKLARLLLERGVRITAVIASEVDAPMTMARLAEFLELPGDNPEIATLVSNKAHFREWMSSNGFSVPRFKVIDEHNYHLVPQFAQEIGYLLMITSRGVV